MCGSVIGLGLIAVSCVILFTNEVSAERDSAEMGQLQTLYLPLHVTAVGSLCPYVQYAGGDPRHLQSNKECGQRVQ